MDRIATPGQLHTHTLLQILVLDANRHILSARNPQKHEVRVKQGQQRSRRGRAVPIRRIMRCSLSNSGLHGGRLTWAPHTMLRARPICAQSPAAPQTVSAPAPELSADGKAVAVAPSGRFGAKSAADLHNLQHADGGRSCASLPPPAPPPAAGVSSAPAVPRGGTRIGSTTPELIAARAQQAHAAKALTAQLRYAPSWRALAQLFADQCSHMNHIHLSALLMRLAHLTTDVPDVGVNGGPEQPQPSAAAHAAPAAPHAASRSSRDRPSVRVLLMRLVPYVGLHLLTFGPRQLSGTMWALGRMGFCPEPAWVAEWCACMARKLDVCTPQDLAMGAWGLVACGALQLEAPTGAPGLLVAMARAMVQTDVLSRCWAQDVSNLVWALATAGVPVTRDLTRPLVHRAHELLTAGATPHDLPSGFSPQSPAGRRFSAQELSGLMWGLGRLGHHHGEALLADLLSHFLALAAPSSVVPAHTQGRSSAAGPQQYATVLWAVAKLRHCPPPSQVSALVEGLVLGPCASASPISGVDPAITGRSTESHGSKGLVPPQLSNQDVAHALWALGSLRYIPPPRLLHPLLRSTYSVLLATAATGGTADEPCVISDDEDGAPPVRPAPDRSRRGSSSVDVASEGAELRRQRVRLMLRTPPAAAAGVKQRAGASGRGSEGSSSSHGELVPMQLVFVVWGLQRLRVRPPAPLRCALQACLSALAPELGSLPPPALADAALSMAWLRMRPSGIVTSALLHALVTRLHGLGPHHLVRLLMALVSLRTALPPAFRVAATAQSLALMAEQPTGQRHGAPGGNGEPGVTHLPPDVTKAASGVASGHSVFDMLLVRPGGAQVLIHMGWALARLGCHSLPTAWATAFIRHALRVLPLLKARELERLVWTVKALRLRPQATLGRAFAAQCLLKADKCAGNYKPASALAQQPAGKMRRGSIQAAAGQELSVVPGSIGNAAEDKGAEAGTSVARPDMQPKPSAAALKGSWAAAARRHGHARRRGRWGAAAAFRARARKVLMRGPPKEGQAERVRRMLVLWQRALVREEGARPVGRAWRYGTNL